MELFYRLKNIPKEHKSLLESLIRVQKEIDGPFQVYTYTVKLPKNARHTEDEVYARHPILLQTLPRACSIFYHQPSDTLYPLEGPKKFSGRSTVDEDDETETELGIYNHNRILEWASSKVLEIQDTEKKNGKFAILRVCRIGNTPYLFAGSKNNHVVIPVHHFETVVEKYRNQELLYGILQECYSIYKELCHPWIQSQFDQGWSLCGEFCDGQHFTEGDNHIYWFGMFRKLIMVYYWVVSINLLWLLFSP